MSDYLDEPVQLNGIGSISHLSDTRTRKRKHPIGFVPNRTKAKPKKKARKGKR